MSKRDTGFGHARYSEREERFLRDCSYVLDMDNSTMIRKCLAIALPQLIGNPFCRCVELDDAIGGLRESVNHLLNKRDTRV